MSFRFALLLLAATLSGCATSNRTPNLTSAASELARNASFDAPCAFDLPAGADSTVAPTDQPPELVGGLEGLTQRLSYPELARRAGIEGKVCLQFIVNEEGAVQDVQVVRSAHPLLDAEAERAVLASTFRPGYQNGEAVKVRFLLPVAFRIRGGPDVIGTLLGVTAVLGIIIALALLQGPPE